MNNKIDVIKTKPAIIPINIFLDVMILSKLFFLIDNVLKSSALLMKPSVLQFLEIYFFSHLQFPLRIIRQNNLDFQLETL